MELYDPTPCITVKADSARVIAQYSVIDAMKTPHTNIIINIVSREAEKLYAASQAARFLVVISAIRSHKLHV